MRQNQQSFALRVRQAFSRRPWLRYAILAAAAVIIVSGAVLTSAPKWVGAILALLVLGANWTVGNWFDSLHEWRIGRYRSPLGDLVKPGMLRSEIDSENQNLGRGTPIDKHAVDELRERLEAAATKLSHADPVTILAGNGESPIGQVVEKACSGIQPRLQCFVPATAKDFVKWLREGVRAMRSYPRSTTPAGRSLFY